MAGGNARAGSKAVHLLLLQDSEQARVAQLALLATQVLEEMELPEQ